MPIVFCRGNGLAETKNNDSKIEIIGKMKHDKANDESESLARKEEKKDNDIIIDHTTQKDHLPAPDEVNARGTKLSETIAVVPIKPHVEADHKEQFKREQDHKHREIAAKRVEELAEEIEVETPRTMDSENEDSDENIMQHTRKEQELVHGKGIEETEEESENTSEEDDDDEDEEDSEESSEGTCDSSIESNIDAIWPTETMDDMLEESTKRKIDNQISEEKTNTCIKTETEKKGSKNDISITNLSKIKDSGESIFISNKRSIKKLPSYSLNTSIWILALVLTLALAAPLVLSFGGIMKLTLAIFFGVGLYRAVNTII